MILAIDFDGVIHDPNNRDKGRRMGKPVPGAREALETLFRHGHTIIVHTVKATDYTGVGAVAKWLDYFEMPHHWVTGAKPNADVYIDDRGYRFTDWESTLQYLEAGSE